LRVTRALFVAAALAPLLAGCETMNSLVPPKTWFSSSDSETEARTTAQQSQSYGDYLNARFAASEHNMIDAARFYRESLQTDPNNGDLLARAFLFTASAGDVDSAGRYAQQVVDQEADNRAARMTLAIVALHNSDYSGARDQLKHSATGPFTALTISLLDAWAAAGEKDPDAALKDLSQLKSQGGTDALEAFHRALILDQAGRSEDADVAYQEALKAAGNGPRVADAYGRYLERAGRIDDAKSFYSKLENDAALAPIVAAAKERIRQGITPQPLVATPEQGAAEALFGIAASLTDDSSADVSVLYLRFARYLRPDLDLANILLADRLETMGKIPEAIEAYKAVDESSPYHEVASVQIAIDEARLEKNDEAIAELKAITVAHPNDIEAWTALGDTYRTLGRFADASDAYDHAIQARGSLDAKAWPLLYARAVAEEQSKHWDLAELDLKQALKLDPEQPEILNYLGYSWVDQGRNLPQALSMLEKARALRPFDGYIADSVGWAYYKVGRFDDAAKALESAVLLVPGDATINDHLGDAYWRVGRKLDARFQWSHALAFNPDPKEKDLLQSKLKTGLQPSSG